MGKQQKIHVSFRRYNSLTEKCILSMKTKGGVLGDEMGLGKL